MRKLLSFGLLISVLMLSACSSYEDVNVAYLPSGNQDYYQTGESYEEIIENDFISVSDLPVSTFSTDVDTASYANLRRYIQSGELPPVDAVRIEEMINYFTYDIAGPTENEVIKIHTELSLAPWNTEHQLMMVGLKTEDIVFEETAGMNLVFLIDVSGSMFADNKLPLLKQAMALLVEQLRPQDRISMVVYAGAAGVVLEGGDATNKEEILMALDDLQAGGSTAGGAGIELAYKVAERNFIEGGNNRIILASDGDFNVGLSSVSALEDLISEKKESGVFLSVLGFGTGNLRDDIMESLADHGNGVYYYIDSYLEAEKVFMHQLGATMVTVAKDVKLQIEFNPLHVKGYRLIGYENRVLDYEDFEDDTKDAGDMGSGHVVIAFYEIIPASSNESIEPKTSELPEILRYNGENYQDEFANIAIRYKHPDEGTSMLIEEQLLATAFTLNPSETFRFASSVVEFGLLLRDSAYKQSANFDQIIERATASLGEDERGYRAEFIELVRHAKVLFQQD